MFVTILFSTGTTQNMLGVGSEDSSSSSSSGPPSSSSSLKMCSSETKPALLSCMWQHIARVNDCFIVILTAGHCWSPVSGSRGEVRGPLTRVRSELWSTETDLCDFWVCFWSYHGLSNSETCVSIHSMMAVREEPTASTVIPLFCPAKGSIRMVQNDQNEGGFSNSLERATVRVYSGTDTSVQHQLQCSIMTL